MPRCADCGFLGLRNREHGGLDEANETYRKTGEVRLLLGNRGEAYDRIPVCAKAVADFASEAKSDERPEIVRVLTIDRQCGEFRRRLVGFTPQMHRQIEMDEFIRNETAGRAKEQRDWQQEQRVEDLKRQERQRAEDLDRQERQRKKDRRRTIVYGVIMAILGAALTVATTQLNKRLDPPAATPTK